MRADEWFCKKQNGKRNTEKLLYISDKKSKKGVLNVKDIIDNKAFWKTLKLLLSEKIKPANCSALAEKKKTESAEEKAAFATLPNHTNYLHSTIEDMTILYLCHNLSCICY